MHACTCVRTSKRMRAYACGVRTHVCVRMSACACACVNVCKCAIVCATSHGTSDGSLPSHGTAELACAGGMGQTNPCEIHGYVRKGQWHKEEHAVQCNHAHARMQVHVPACTLTHPTWLSGAGWAWWPRAAVACPPASSRAPSRRRLQRSEERQQKGGGEWKWRTRWARAASPTRWWGVGHARGWGWWRRLRQRPQRRRAYLSCPVLR